MLKYVIFSAIAFVVGFATGKIARLVTSKKKAFSRQ